VGVLGGVGCEWLEGRTISKGNDRGWVTGVETETRGGEKEDQERQSLLDKDVKKRTKTTRHGSALNE